MDKAQVHKTINQLVESLYDQRQAQTHLRNFQDANDPPLAPNAFESLEAFLNFYGHHQDHENRVRSLETEYANATEQYDQARFALSRVLPRDAPLYYTYKGSREELKDRQYEIINLAAAGRGQIRITPRAAQP
jgi:hypothetical protein